MTRLISWMACLLFALGAREPCGGDSVPAVSDTARSLSVDLSCDSLISSYLGDVDSTSIRRIIQEVAGFRTRFMLAENRKEIAVWIRDRFRSYGYEDVTTDSFQNKVEFPIGSNTYHTTWQYNVVATLKGRSKLDSIFVLGAHYDCVATEAGESPFINAPGADNNASGLAACLEIARVMKRRSFRPRQTIQFVAFGSEEFMTMFAEGKSGSEYYVSKALESGQKIAAMIDNNQIGYSPGSDPWKVDLQNYPGSAWLTELAHFLCGKFTRITPVDANDHIDYTDARYFAKAGYPTIFFEEFQFCPFTLTVSDTPDKCNAAYCAEVTKISGAILIYLNR
jgi:hypothetical protein